MAIAGKGTTFYWTSGDSGNYELGDIPNFSLGGGGDTYDVSSLDSSGGFRNHIRGLRDAGTLGFQMSSTREQYDVLMDLYNGGIESFMLVFPDDDETTLTFDGFIQELDIELTGDDMVLHNVLTKITGGITSTIGGAFAFASTDGNTNQNYDIKLPVGSTITINWGDGNSDDYNGNDDTIVNPTHTYSGVGSYDITLSGDYLDLTYLNCQLNSLEGDVSGWSALTSLTFLRCNNNYLEGDVSGWSVLTSLTNLICYSNSLEGDVSGWSALTSLTYLRCQNNYLDFNAVTAWAALDLGVNCNLSDNSMTSTQVDNALNSFDNGPFADTTITLDGTNAARTSASDAAVTTLEAAGCTIITS